MKSVLLSLHPNWCHEIFNKRKTVEIRKNKPNLQVPFKVYVYCTKDGAIFGDLSTYKKPKTPLFYNKHLLNGKVIGEFTVDRIDKYRFSNYNAQYDINDVDLMATRMNHPELIQYGKGETLYGWHITNPILYDKPKKLSEFKKPCNHFDCCICKRAIYINGIIDNCNDMIARPPQSWCYVERMG